MWPQGSGGLSLRLAPLFVVIALAPLPELILHQALLGEASVLIDGEGG